MDCMGFKGCAGWRGLCGLCGLHGVGMGLAWDGHEMA